MNDALLILTTGESAAIDYACDARSRGRRPSLVGPPSVVDEAPSSLAARRWDALFASPVELDPPHVAIFVGAGAPRTDRDLLDRLVARWRSSPRSTVLLITGCGVHWGERSAEETESRWTTAFASAARRTFVVRAGRLLSPRSQAARRLARLAPWSPLAPQRLRSSFLDGAELFQALDDELFGAPSTVHRTVTLLGPNRTWREQFDRMRAAGEAPPAGRLAKCLAWTGAGRLAAWGLAVGKRWIPSWRAVDFDTLRPRSTAELLSLYNRHGLRHVRIVGYNNGVVHFGQRHAGRTIVSTSQAARAPRLHGGLLKVDAGTTIGRATACLRTFGKELHVVPNFSFVALGTAFFVPIHGSACEFATLGETIERALLYDPTLDRLLIARRGAPEFADALYNLSRDLLLLRLYVRVKPAGRYFVRRQELAAGSGDELLRLFDDAEAANIEIRKARAASPAIQVNKYYTGAAPSGGRAVEAPRDSVGRVWDRIETTPVLGRLFHWLVRRFGYHVELFFDRGEFPKFWETHAGLPLSKIQLRYIRRDGFPHSPFCDTDRISADIFLWRRHKEAFQEYLRTTFTSVRANPGKHSL